MKAILKAVKLKYLYTKKNILCNTTQKRVSNSLKISKYKKTKKIKRNKNEIKSKERDLDKLQLWEWTLPKYRGTPPIPYGKRIKIHSI